MINQVTIPTFLLPTTDTRAHEISAVWKKTPGKIGLKQNNGNIFLHINKNLPVQCRCSHTISLTVANCQCWICSLSAITNNNINSYITISNTKESFDFMDVSELALTYQMNFMEIKSDIESFHRTNIFLLQIGQVSAFSTVDIFELKLPDLTNGVHYRLPKSSSCFL